MWWMEVKTLQDRIVTTISETADVHFQNPGSLAPLDYVPGFSTARTNVPVLGRNV
jgi:hypothetical protein